MAIDLTQLPARFIAKHGRAKCCEVTGLKPSVAAMHEKTNRFSLDAANRMLTFDPAILGPITPLYTHPVFENKLMILVPLATAPAPKAMDSLLYLFDKHEMTFERFSFNCLSVSRNVLAARFLASSAQWAWWQDVGDTVVPCGNADWFRAAAECPDMSDAFAGLNSIYRALWHKKTIVSCCYIARRPGGPPQFGGGDARPMIDLVRKGPQDKLIEVPWVGFGGVLTHRSVFEAIIKTQEDEIRMKRDGVGARFGYEYGFFDPHGREVPGDDLPLCERAIRAGHKIYVDLAIQAAHIGDRPYSFNDL